MVNAVTELLNHSNVPWEKISHEDHDFSFWCPVPVTYNWQFSWLEGELQVNCQLNNTTVTIRLSEWNNNLNEVKSAQTNLSPKAVLEAKYSYIPWTTWFTVIETLYLLTTAKNGCIFCSPSTASIKIENRHFPATNPVNWCYLDWMEMESHDFLGISVLPQTFTSTSSL